MHDDFDTLTVMLFISAWAVFILLVALRLVVMWERRKLRKLQEHHRKLRYDYGYQKIWHDAEERLLSRLRAGQRHLVLQDIDLHAEELAAIRAQRFGLPSMDVAAARRDLVAKLMH